MLSGTGRDLVICAGWSFILPPDMIRPPPDEPAGAVSVFD